MVIQAEMYPTVGYQQQTYAAYQDGYYSTAGQYSSYPTKPAAPAAPTANPYVATPQYSNGYVMPSGGYAQQHDGWYDKNKHQSGWNGTSAQHNSQGSNGYAPHYGYSNDAYKQPGGKFNHEMQNTGYETYHGAHDYGKYDRVRCPTTMYHDCSGGGYPTAAVWTLKGVD